MSYKKVIVVFVLTTIIVICLLMSFSYAYYVGTGNQGTSFTATTSEDAPKVIFAESSNINMTIGLPILSSNVDTQAEKSDFTITYGTELSGKSIAIKIDICDITIDPMLKDSSFKYQLLKNGTSIVTGNFGNVSGDTVTLMGLTNTNISTYPSTDNYQLRIWLEEICSDLTDVTTCSDYSAWNSAYTSGEETYPYNSVNSTKYGQNRMMNKTFKGKIKVTSAIR